jgi:hypothetical protein
LAETLACEGEVSPLRWQDFESGELEMQRLTRSLVISAVAVLAGLIASAPQALAQGPPAVPSVSAVVISACNLQVCETVLQAPPPTLVVRASATPTSVRCGHFLMTVTTSFGSIRELSPTVCALRPVYTFRTFLTTRTAMTITMQLISIPPTPGKPVIHLF